MWDKTIQMVDLRGQYRRMQTEMDAAMQTVLQSGVFINGPEVKAFSEQLAGYLAVPYVIPCGNGTDALQMALMALELQPGDEVIVPAFTYAAAVEVILLLGMTPVLVDIDPLTYNIDATQIEQAVSNRTKAIIIVHLFGQCSHMEPILRIAEKYQLYTIEDNAQSMGATYTFSDGSSRKAGTMGTIGTTSFFPTKPLACYGDGGAMFTADPVLAERLRMLTQHGQDRKYSHKIVGCNSRLDTIQAAVLRVKLKHLDDFREARQQVANRYDNAFRSVEWIKIPAREPGANHIYHQYTIRVAATRRDDLQAYLAAKGIPTMIYYPMAIHEQEAFRTGSRLYGTLPEAIQTSKEVLSLPIHTEMTEKEVTYIIDTIRIYGEK